MTIDHRIRTSSSVVGVVVPPVVDGPNAFRLDGSAIKRKRVRQVLDWVWVFRPDSTPRRWWLPLAGIGFVILVLYLTVYREYLKDEKLPSGAITSPNLDENGQRLSGPFTKPDPNPWKK
jgi:hypothetical protein